MHIALQLQYPYKPGKMIKYYLQTSPPTADVTNIWDVPKPKTSRFIFCNLSNDNSRPISNKKNTIPSSPKIKHNFFVEFNHDINKKNINHRQTQVRVAY